MRPSTRLTVVAIVFVLVVTRLAITGHMAFEWEEPISFWAPAHDADAIGFLISPWAGYLEVVARAGFFFAVPFGPEVGPLVTRIEGAAIIALIAGYVSGRYGAAAGIALALLPISEPYVGPLNSQWWLAIAVLVMALGPARVWHVPVLVVAGLSGIAPILAAPVFRDRRVILLLAAAILQIAVLLTSTRRPAGFGISVEFVTVGALLVGVLLLARNLPARDRVAFAWLGLVTILLGSWTTGGAIGGWRYLTAAWAGIAIALFADAGVVAMIRSQHFSRTARVS